uniref:Uncharacterized protein n=1 Tax=Anguilla anguilla TaxID=7936 RepID=A0A0E9QY91_ANGAN
MRYQPQSLFPLRGGLLPGTALCSLSFRSIMSEMLGMTSDFSLASSSVGAARGGQGEGPGHAEREGSRTGNRN